MNKNTLLLSLVSLGSLLAGIGVFYLLSPNAVVSTHKDQVITEENPTQFSLKTIPLTDLDGNQKLLGNWQQPILIVNFWAPWCAPCREEIPALIALQNEFKDQVQIIGLALDGEDNVRNFETEYGMNYPSFLVGNKISMYNAVFDNKTGGLPFTAIIDQNRSIQFKHNGGITLAELRSQLSPLL